MQVTRMLGCFLEGSPSSVSKVDWDISMLLWSRSSFISGCGEGRHFCDDPGWRGGWPRCCCQARLPSPRSLNGKTPHNRRIDVGEDGDIKWEDIFFGEIRCFQVILLSRAGKLGAIRMGRC